MFSWETVVSLEHRNYL